MWKTETSAGINVWYGAQMSTYPANTPWIFFGIRIVRPAVFGREDFTVMKED
jgi:hypothetical protein